jgi:hypothetical protein
LVNSRKLDVLVRELCEIADGRHPAARDDTASPSHYQLMTLGFRVLPDEGPDDDGMAAIKAALHQPVHGDRALIAFLNRNAAGS